MANLIRTFIRIPEDLHAILKQRAEDESRSLNGQIIYLLRRAIAAGM
jgi:hypothetical protein